MFNFLKKLAGGGKESCGAGSCGTTKTEGSCSTQKPKEMKMEGGCCPHGEDTTAPKGACH